MAETDSTAEQHAPGPAEQLADERKLLRRYAADRDPVVREELVQRFMPLARRLAARYRGDREPLEDLVQVASLGLVKALDRFDPERGVAFSSYAVPTILGELKRHFRDRGWSVRVPRDLQERIAKVERAAARLPAKLGRVPTVNEIAKQLELDPEEVLEAMQAGQAHHAMSLDAQQQTEDGEGIPLSERVGSDDPGFDTVEYGVAIEDALQSLSERDRMVLHLRFIEDLTQTQIAEQVGVSQMHVSRILRGALERLREEAARQA
ncbi:MAG TPA: SigB/SigF/SigG family RNA polymerase sigma factor [Solirubrobacterales bacterium]|nr:SigB/SigF/SigG family RNA polymerase sigma factor [Solirubrobacterales bacterium]